jgi:hypothetical protein
LTKTTFSDNLYRVSKILQYFIPEERGVIPRFPEIEDIWGAEKLLERGIACISYLFLKYTKYI